MVCTSMNVEILKIKQACRNICYERKRYTYEQGLLLFMSGLRGHNSLKSTKQNLHNYMRKILDITLPYNPDTSTIGAGQISRSLSQTCILTADCEAQYLVGLCLLKVFARWIHKRTSVNDYNIYTCIYILSSILSSIYTCPE